MNSVSNVVSKQMPVASNSNLTFKTTPGQRTRRRNNDSLEIVNERDKKHSKRDTSNIPNWIVAVSMGLIALFTGLGFGVKKLVAKEQTKMLKAQKEYFEKGVKSMGKEAEEGNVAELVKNMWRNISGEKSLDDLALPETLIDVSEKIGNSLLHADRLRGMNQTPVSTILLYGPPGTGKTAFVTAIAKKYGADFAYLDVGVMKDMYNGGSEKRINAMIDGVCERAKQYLEEYKAELGKVIGEDIVKRGNQEEIDIAIDTARNSGKKIPELKRVFVLADEIDSMIMVDEGTGKKLSQDMLNEFKKGFTDKLGKYENITVFGCTNLTINPEAYATMDGKKLDTAMLDRFAMKVLVDNPVSGQLKNTILNIFKKCNPKYIAEELRKDNDRLTGLCDFLAIREHNFSFRNLLSLLKETSNAIVAEDKAMEIKDICDQLRKSFASYGMTKEEVENAIQEIMKKSNSPYKP